LPNGLSSQDFNQSREFLILDPEDQAAIYAYYSSIFFLVKAKLAGRMEDFPKLSGDIETIGKQVMAKRENPLRTHIPKW
jgi:hypothetical protein